MMAYIPLIIFLAYLTYALIKVRQVPASLSDTYYLLKGSGILFTVAMFAVGLSSMVAMIDRTANWQFVPFLCGASICFVGAAPEFKSEMTSKVHTVAAIFAAVCGMFWVAVLTYFWWVIPVILVGCAVLGYITGSLRRCCIFWLEMTAFFSVFTTLILT